MNQSSAVRTLYSTAGQSPIEAWRSWDAMSQNEFYCGDLEPPSIRPPELLYRKSLGYPIALTYLKCTAPIAYRRSWQHIRDDRAGARVIWFVQGGSLTFGRPRGGFALGAGEAGIVDSNAPFTGAIECDSKSAFESYQAIVPIHLFMTHLSRAEKFSGAIPLHRRHGHLVERLLEVLICEGELLSRGVAESLTAAFLEGISDCLGEEKMAANKPQRLVDRRFADIEQAILLGLGDPDLNTSRIAAGCRISTRYLHYLLRANHTSFSQLLWTNRLHRARESLASPQTKDRPINEVAYLSGFKSTAHFCRMFKDAYGNTPGEYRAAHAAA